MRGLAGMVFLRICGGGGIRISQAHERASCRGAFEGLVQVWYENRHPGGWPKPGGGEDLSCVSWMKSRRIQLRHDFAGNPTVILDCVRVVVSRLATSLELGRADDEPPFLGLLGDVEDVKECSFVNLQQAGDYKTQKHKESQTKELERTELPESFTPYHADTLDILSLHDSPRSISVTQSIFGA